MTRHPYAPAEFLQDQVYRAILSALRNQAMSLPELCDDLGRRSRTENLPEQNRSQVNSHLRVLTKRGLLKRSKERGGPYRYRLATDFSDVNSAFLRTLHLEFLEALSKDERRRPFGPWTLGHVVLHGLHASSRHGDLGKPIRFDRRKDHVEASKSQRLRLARLAKGELIDIIVSTTPSHLDPLRDLDRVMEDLAEAVYQDDPGFQELKSKEKKLNARWFEISEEIYGRVLRRRGLKRLALPRVLLSDEPREPADKVHEEIDAEVRQDLRILRIEKDRAQVRHALLMYAFAVSVVWPRETVRRSFALKANFDPFVAPLEP